MPTVLHRLSEWAKESPQEVAQRYKEGDRWLDLTASTFRDRVFYLALHLEARGLSSEDAGVILSYNCPEWVHMDLAILLVGAKSAGLYPNSTTKDIRYILEHTQAKVIAVQNKDYFLKITDNGQLELPSTIQEIIVFDGDTSFSPLAVSYAEAISEGEKLAQTREMTDYLDRVDKDRGVILIYTSGTTGNPKGALLSHDNLTFTSDTILDTWKLRELKGGSLFSFLPLCHIAEKLQNVGVGISGRFVVNYCSKFENVAKELPEVQPDLLLCVPRLWEKMMEGVENKLKQATGFKKILAQRAFAAARALSASKYEGKSASIKDLLFYPIGNALVLSKVKQALGLKGCKVAASGAAALPVHVARWFRVLGVEILEVFGQTESTGIVTATELGVDGIGTVGKPFPHTEFKLAEDGEILSRGRTVFKGYYKNDEATRETVDSEGWLHTGDLGEVNEKGQVLIRGRKKEVLKTSGGKMIAPLPIEERLKASPIISQVCMVGDGRKYLSALITLSEDTNAQLKKNGKIVREPNVVSEVQKYIDEINSSLAGFEQIKKFSILSEEFSIESGEMTPTLKMKRNVIEDHFKDVIDQMYNV